MFKTSIADAAAKSCVSSGSNILVDTGGQESFGPKGTNKDQKCSLLSCVKNLEKDFCSAPSCWLKISGGGKVDDSNYACEFC